MNIFFKTMKFKCAIKLLKQTNIICDLQLIVLFSSKCGNCNQYLFFFHVFMCKIFVNSLSIFSSLFFIL